MHRELPCERLVATVEVDEHADLVRRRMHVGGDRAAVVVALGTGDDDVLAELAHQLHALLVERRGRIDAVRVDGTEHALGERLELVVLRDGLGLAADADDRADAAVDDRADEALGGRPVGALAGLRHALLAQQGAGGVEIAVRLLQRPLAIHHPRAGELTELLDEACTDLGHAFSSSQFQ